MKDGFNAAKKVKEQQQQQKEKDKQQEHEKQQEQDGRKTEQEGKRKEEQEGEGLSHTEPGGKQQQQQQQQQHGGSGSSRKQQPQHGGGGQVESQQQKDEGSMPDDKSESERVAVSAPPSGCSPPLSSDDGLRALVTVAMQVGSRRELWGLASDVDAVTPRRLVVHSMMKEPLINSFLHMLGEGEEEGQGVDAASAASAASPSPATEGSDPACGTEDITAGATACVAATPAPSTAAPAAAHAPARPRSSALPQKGLREAGPEGGGEGERDEAGEVRREGIHSSALPPQSLEEGDEERGKSLRGGVKEDSERGCLRKRFPVCPHLRLGCISSEVYPRTPFCINSTEMEDAERARLVRAEVSVVQRALRALWKRRVEVGIKHICFGDYFDPARAWDSSHAGVWDDKCLCLPEGLESVQFGTHFNSPVASVHALKHLARAVKDANDTLTVARTTPSTAALDGLPAFVVAISESGGALHVLSEAMNSSGLLTLPKSLRKVEFHSGSVFDQPLMLLPPTLEELILGSSFKQFLLLPDSLRRLVFEPEPPGSDRQDGSVFNRPLHLPPRLVELSLPNQFDQPIALPASLRKLRFGRTFNQLVVLPHGVEEVDMGYYFNLPLELPASLKKLTLSHFFNQPLLILPSSLEELSLGFEFNQPGLVLPPSLRKVQLSTRFSQQISLPPGLQEVNFGVDYNLPVLLSRSVRSATFGDGFTESVLFEQPSSLSYLRMEGTAVTRPLLNLPPSLRELSISGSFNHQLQLPEGLEILRLVMEFNLPLELPQSLICLELTSGLFNQDIILPPKLETAHFGFHFNRPLVLPPSLRELSFFRDFNHALELPSSLRTLRFGVSFDQDIELPEGLEEVVFGADFCRPLCIPSSLLRLNLGLTFSETLTVSAPCRLQTVDFGDWFNAPVELGGWADLRVVKFGARFNQTLNLPQGLQQLEVGYYYSKALQTPLPPRLHTLRIRSHSYRHRLHLPPALALLSFYGPLQRGVALPMSLKQVEYHNPSGAEELSRQARPPGYRLSPGQEGYWNGLDPFFVLPPGNREVLGIGIDSIVTVSIGPPYGPPL